MVVRKSEIRVSGRVTAHQFPMSYKKILSRRYLRFVDIQIIRNSDVDMINTAFMNFE